MTDEKIKEVDYFLSSKWTTVDWECPFCGYKNEEDYTNFDSEEIWYGHPQTECEECGAEVVLGDKDYD